MNIIFFGSSKFAAPSLKALLAAKHNVSCVVTQPDREKGRGLHCAGTVIKEIASESGVKIYQPCNVNEPEAVKFLKSLNADLFVVIAYGQILSKAVLSVPKIFSINVHASILPKYRGAAPINRAIINGEKSSGVTVIKMTESLDAGPVILNKETEISDSDTADSLSDKLSDLAEESLLDSIGLIENNKYRLIEQDEKKISFASKLKKDDGKIDWNRPAGEIYNLIRGCISWPGAYTNYNGKMIKIYKAIASIGPGREVSYSPGEITGISKQAITVATGSGSLLIEELQLEGKRRMRVDEFMAGHKIALGSFFS